MHVQLKYHRGSLLFFCDTPLVFNDLFSNRKVRDLENADIKGEQLIFTDHVFYVNGYGEFYRLVKKSYALDSITLNAIENLLVSSQK